MWLTHTGKNWRVIGEICDIACLSHKLTLITRYLIKRRGWQIVNRHDGAGLELESRNLWNVLNGVVNYMVNTDHLILQLSENLNLVRLLCEWGKSQCHFNLLMIFFTATALHNSFTIPTVIAARPTMVSNNNHYNKSIFLTTVFANFILISVQLGNKSLSNHHML